MICNLEAEKKIMFLFENFAYKNVCEPFKQQSHCSSIVTFPHSSRFLCQLVATIYFSHLFCLVFLGVVKTIVGYFSYGVVV